MNLIEHLQSFTDSQKVILNFYKDFNKVQSFTMKKLLAIARERSLIYQAQLPKERSTVILCHDTGEDFVLDFLALVICGHTPVTLCPPSLMLKKDFSLLLRKISNSANAQHYLSSFSLKSESQLQKLTLNHEKTHSPTPPLLESDPVFIQFSSGSTRDPKGIVVTHKNLMANLKQITSGLELGDSESICSWLPLHHDMGLIGGLFSALYCHNTANLMSPIDYMLRPLEWLRLITTTQSTFLCAPNSAYHVIAKKVQKNHLPWLDLSSIRVAMCGAEPISMRTLDNLAKALAPYGFKKEAIQPVYGLAEATLAVAFSELNSPPKALEIDPDSLFTSNTAIKSLESNAMTVVSCGKALPEIKIEIRNEQGLPLEESMQGEIWISGPNVCSHYFQKAGHLINGWLNTEDTGFFYREELYITGRTKDLIIVGGKNYAPQDFEHQIAHVVEEVKIGRVAAVGLTNPQATEEVHIVVENDQLLNEKKRKDLRKRIANAASRICLTSERNVHILPQLNIPKTTSGKIQRSKIKTLLGQNHYHAIESDYIKHQIKAKLIKSQFKVSFLLGRWLNKKSSPENTNENRLH